MGSFQIVIGSGETGMCCETGIPVSSIKRESDCFVFLMKGGRDDGKKRLL